MIFDTGERAQELIGLRRDGLDLDREVMPITDKGGGNASCRSVPASWPRSTFTSASVPDILIRPF